MSDNIGLEEKVSILTETVMNLVDLISGNQSKINELSEQNRILKEYCELLKKQLYNIPYECNDPRREFYYTYPMMESHEETVRRICEEGMSLGRYGDAEFSIMMGDPRHEYQRMDERLAERLTQVIQSDLPNLIIGIADNFGDISRFNENGLRGIRAYIDEDVRGFLSQVMDTNRIYADAYLTRFYAMYRDNMTDGPRRRLENLRKIWDNRDIIIVEGAHTRLGQGNDLFANVKSIRRILAPATSSFDRYDDILASAINHAEEDILYMIAIGPSAAVLAYDLTKEGIQAVDVGNIDMEYEWFLKGLGHRCSVPHKYNNEVIGDDEVADIDDPVYEGQIIDRYDL